MNIILLILYNIHCNLKLKKYIIFILGIVNFSVYIQYLNT